METIKRTVEDERQADKSLEDDAHGFRVNRFEKKPHARIDDIGVSQELKLREEDDREAMIAAIRADAAEKYGFTVEENLEVEATEVDEDPIEAAEIVDSTVAENPKVEATEVDEDPSEVAEIDPRFIALCEQYRALPKRNRT